MMYVIIEEGMGGGIDPKDVYAEFQVQTGNDQDKLDLLIRAWDNFTLEELQQRLKP